MRILLAHKFWELTGGADVFFRETERVLRENGHETFMVATGVPEEGQPNNLELMTAPHYEAGGMLEKARHLPAAIYDRRKRDRFREIIREFRPDVVHIFAINVHLSLSLIDAAKAEDVPIVATFNDYKHICPNYKLFADGEICMACKGGKFYNAALKSCCKGSRALSVASMIEAYTHQVMGLYSKIDHFTFSSDFLAETTQDFWAGRQLSWSKLLNPFDSAKYTNSAGFEPFGLYFGRIIDEKGVDRIVDAAGLIDGYQIKIIGNGPDEDMLRERVACEGLDNVEFLGPKWGAELDAILSKAAFVIVPSIWHENFPYVINQAFAFGRPVVGARRGGITELVADGERGLIFEPDSPEELADAIRRLVAAPEEIRRMGANAKTYSDALFNDEASLANLMRAYEEVL
jgi:glycosyltransferase involved in cell wall biosynthesis